MQLNHTAHPNLDLALDHAAVRADGFAQPLSDGRILICAATTSPIMLGADKVAWLHMPGAELSMLNSGRAPLVMSHGYDLESLIGIVERAWTDDTSLYVVARLGRTGAGRRAWRQVEDRVLVNASIAFSAVLDTEPDGTGAHRAAWWRPREVSLVTMPRNWEAQTFGAAFPIRVRKALADTAVLAASGTPETWRRWAADAAGPLAASSGMNALALEAELLAAVDAELLRLAGEARAAIEGPPAHCPTLAA